jgi:hypothetical protein
VDRPPAATAGVTPSCDISPRQVRGSWPRR